MTDPIPDDVPKLVEMKLAAIDGPVIPMARHHMDALLAVARDHARMKTDLELAEADAALCRERLGDLREVARDHARLTARVADLETLLTHGTPCQVPDGHTRIDGKRWRVIPTGFGYDDGSQSCRLVPTEVAQDQVDWQTPCSHAIYHHGCPSCDRQDPEDR